MAVTRSKPWVSVLFGAFLIGAWHTEAAPEPHRFALAIGNSAYAEGALANPGNDAADIAAKLRALGFAVELRRDADQQAMEEAIRAFTGRLAGKGKVGLFYFAGHGVEYEGRNYLIPIGANLHTEIDLRYEAVDAGRVLDGMAAAGNGLNIVVLDACRNNPYRSMFRSPSRGLARMTPARGSLVFYATQPGAMARDGNERNGVFTKHLLSAMDEPGLEVEQVFKQVALAVDRETKGQQTPWSEGVLLGNFQFRPAEPSKPNGPIATTPATSAIPTAPPPPALGHLRVRVIATSEVWLDGSQVGVAAPDQPLNLTNLASGSHRVEVRTGGGEPVARELLIEPGRWSEVTLPVPPVSADPARGEAQLSLDAAHRHQVQAWLAALGYSPGPIDGVLGPATRAAITAWQRSAGLWDSGYLDRAQHERLAHDGDAADGEETYWAAIRATRKVEVLQGFVALYPHGDLARKAEARIKVLRQAARRAREKATRNVEANDKPSNSEDSKKLQNEINEFNKQMEDEMKDAIEKA